MTSPQYFSRKTLAERYGTTSDHLAKLAIKGQGPPYFMLGKYCRYPLEELIKWESLRLEEIISNSKNIGEHYE